jgi:hypothetical protein
METRDIVTLILLLVLLAAIVINLLTGKILPWF